MNGLQQTTCSIFVVKNVLHIFFLFCIFTSSENYQLYYFTNLIIVLWKKLLSRWLILMPLK